jgi:UDPglucose 6-dehydrogenase
MISRNKITIVGSGYVGMSLSVLLAQANDVCVLDIDKSRVNKINEKKPTIEDPQIEEFLKNKNLSLKATTDKNVAYEDADFIIVATPTNYDSDNNYFDTSSVDEVVSDAINLNKEALVIIKSTVPVGHTKILQKKLLTNKVIFSPEFLREGQALKDNLYPSRIIIGSNCMQSKRFAELLQNSSLKDSVETLFIGSTEAEAVKLFANAYLAMRVAFFNELDSYALNHDLDTESIINDICLDERIGKGYNNPSFGYGGYCLPKDTKQLLANYGEIPQTLIKSIVTSNEVRIKLIADEIIKLQPKTIGFHRLVMKKGSDNFRSSAVQRVIEILRNYNYNIVIYEPSFDSKFFNNISVSKSLDEFKSVSDVIVSNRISKELNDVKNKIFTRDIFNDN